MDAMTAYAPTNNCLNGMDLVVCLDSHLYAAPGFDLITRPIACTIFVEPVTSGPCTAAERALDFILALPSTVIRGSSR